MYSTGAGKERNINHTRLWRRRVEYKLPVGTETRTAPRPTMEEILSLGSDRDQDKLHTILNL